VQGFVPASRLRYAQALRRSALKSVHWTDLTGKPVVPHSFAFGEPL
jgi:hypothetical protein